MSGHPRISAEASFLYHLAGPGGEPDQVPSALAWNEVIRLADREKAISALFQRVGSSLAPEQSRRLQALRLAWSMRMAYLEQSLEALLARYQREGIRVVLLKGAALAVLVYRSFSARPMADLDLLVEPERALEAWKLACETGWNATHQPDSYQGHQHLPPLDDARGAGLGLELHTDLLPANCRFAFGAEQLWRNAVPVEVGGQPGLVPSDGDMALHLCIHFAWSHSLVDAAWRTIHDLNALIATGRIAWPELAQRARAARATTCVYWTLRLGRRLSALAVPEDLLKELEPPLPKVFRRSVERYYCTVLCRPPQWQERTRIVSRTLWRLAILPGWSGLGDARPWGREHLFTGEGDGGNDQETPSPGQRWKQLFRELRTLVP